MYRTHECSVHVAHVVQCMGTAQDQIEHIYGEAQVQLGVAAIPPRLEVSPQKPLGSACASTSSPETWYLLPLEQYFLGSNLGGTHLPGQQAASVSENTPIFIPEPNEDEPKNLAKPTLLPRGNRQKQS